MRRAMTPHLTRLRRESIYGTSMVRGRFQGTVTGTAEQLRAIERLYLNHLNLRRLCRYSDGQAYTMIFRCVCFPGFNSYVLKDSFSSKAGAPRLARLPQWD